MLSVDELWGAVYQQRQDHLVGRLVVGNLDDDVLAFVLAEEQSKMPDSDLPGLIVCFN
jgi:hypothetical protein